MKRIDIEIIDQDSLTKFNNLREKHSLSNFSYYTSEKQMKQCQN